MDARDSVIVRPDGFHFSHVQRFKGRVKASIRGAQCIFGSLLVRSSLCGHDDIQKSEIRQQKLENRKPFWPLHLTPDGSGFSLEDLKSADRR
jgi:hypothetical protein